IRPAALQSFRSASGARGGSVDSRDLAIRLPRLATAHRHWGRRWKGPWHPWAAGLRPASTRALSGGYIVPCVICPLSRGPGNRFHSACLAALTRWTIGARLTGLRALEGDQSCPLIAEA